MVSLLTTIENYSNLLNFLPSSVFYGQRPSLWWTKRHDIDLIVGTYKYGYANYQLMRSNLSFKFHKLEGGFQEFPNADTITRRLKKLIQIIVKEQPNLKKLNFTANNALETESTGWSLSEKKCILELVTDFGIPITSEGKYDWTLLREMLSQRILKDNEPEKSNITEKGVQSLEKFVQKLRIYSQELIDNTISTNEFGSDKDGFFISLEQARELYENINLLSYIRTQLLSGNAKTVNNGLTSLTDNLQKYRLEKHPNLPETWKPQIHDKGLLYAISENGFSVLEDLSKTKQYGFEDMPISSHDARKRLEYLCEFYWNFSAVTKVVKKRKLPEKSETKAVTKKKHNKVIVEKDEDGNIVFPIVINGSLSIQSLGYIDGEKKYHSEK